MNKHTPLWGCSASLLSVNGLKLCSNLALGMYKLLGMRKVATSAYHRNGNGGVGRVNQTMAQMPAMVVNERQDDWDAYSPYVTFAYNNSISASTGLIPNEVHMNRLPRFPLTVFDPPYARSLQSLEVDYVEFFDLAADCQKCTYYLVRKQHALTVAHVESRN